MDEELTTKEEVRQRLAEGQSVRDIAGSLGLSTQRVYQHKHALEGRPDKKSRPKPKPKKEKKA